MEIDVIKRRRAISVINTTVIDHLFWGSLNLNLAYIKFKFELKRIYKNAEWFRRTLDKCIDLKNREKISIDFLRKREIERS